MSNDKLIIKMAKNTNEIELKEEEEEKKNETIVDSSLMPDWMCVSVCAIPVAISLGKAHKTAQKVILMSSCDSMPILGEKWAEKREIGLQTMLIIAPLLTITFPALMWSNDGSQ